MQNKNCIIEVKWPCMKCMHERHSSRYQTAELFVKTTVAETLIDCPCLFSIYGPHVDIKKENYEKSS